MTRVSYQRGGAEEKTNGVSEGLNAYLGTTLLRPSPSQSGRNFPLLPQLSSFTCASPRETADLIQHCLLPSWRKVSQFTSRTMINGHGMDVRHSAPFPYLQAASWTAQRTASPPPRSRGRRTRARSSRGPAPAPSARSYRTTTRCG